MHMQNVRGRKKKQLCKESGRENIVKENCFCEKGREKGILIGKDKKQRSHYREKQCKESVIGERYLKIAVEHMLLKEEDKNSWKERHELKIEFFRGSWNNEIETMREENTKREKMNDENTWREKMSEFENVKEKWLRGSVPVHYKQYHLHTHINSSNPTTPIVDNMNLASNLSSCRGLVLVMSIPLKTLGRSSKPNHLMNLLGQINLHIQDPPLHQMIHVILLHLNLSLVIMDLPLYLKAMKVL